MDPREILVLIPFAVLSIPIVAIVTTHQRKMLELRLRLKGEGTETQPGKSEVSGDLKTELQEIKTQLAQLRDTTTKFDMSFDAALSRLENRVDGMEGHPQSAVSAAPAPPIIVPTAMPVAPPPLAAPPIITTVTTSAPSPEVVTVGQQRG